MEHAGRGRSSTTGSPARTAATVYANRAVLFVRSKWGKILAQEDFEDCERVTAYEREYLDADGRPLAQVS